jgi:hypothetical protein
MTRLEGANMKIVLVTLLTIGSLNAFAGGGPIHDTPPCLQTDAAEVLLTEGKVLDRGGHEVNYRIVMKAERCQSKVKTFTRKNLFLHYDAPVQRSEKDGLLLGETINWSGNAFDIFQEFSLRVHEDTVTKEGLKILIGGMAVDNTLPLLSIPKGFIGDKGTIITVVGNAFPTHSIQGPFAK